MIAVILASGMGAIKLLSSNFEDPLPNWIDPVREISDGRPPVFLSRAVPPGDFRIPAEYEPVYAVVLGWRGYTSMLSRIATIVTEVGGANIWIANGPGGIPGIPGSLYSFIDCPLNTVWMRDYGPFGISLNKQRHGIIDSTYRHYQYRRDDDALPSCLGEEKSISTYNFDIVLDGGNVMVDTEGNLFMTKRTYMWNSALSPEEVDEKLKTYFNLQSIHAIEYAGYPDHPLDGTGHIDMFAKLVSDNTVLIAFSMEEPFKSNSEKAIEYFKGLTTPDGGHYRIFTLPGVMRNRTWYTYTNSLIVNNVVIIPGYSDFPEENLEARKTYEEAIPGVIVKEVNSDNSIHSGGSIHCLTQTIPAVIQ